MTTSRDQRRDEITKDDLATLNEMYDLDPAFCSLFTSYMLQARAAYEDYQRMCLQMSNFGPPIYRERFKSFALEAEPPKFLSLLPEALTRLQTPRVIEGYEDKVTFADPQDRWWPR